MNYKKRNIKSGINVHLINTNKFKTNLFSVFITLPLNRETITKNALLAAVLKRGTTQMPTQEKISKQLQNMYGASFDCGIDKTGENQIIKFYVEAVNDNFLPDEDTIFEKCLNVLLSIVFDPITKNDKFLDEYVQSEKENLKQIIQSKIDNKTKYAVDRCIEEMYKNQSYGLYKYGYVEDLKDINSQDLYEYYKKAIDKAKIDIFISGQLSEDNIDIIKSNEIIEKLKDRQPNYVVNSIKQEKQKIEQPKVIEEKMQINQGKLILGLTKFDTQDSKEKYALSVYNIILGGSANSKLFQNVREKASLAYTASSNYIRVKDNIIIKSGIEIKNYDKALEIIKEQLKQIEKGEFTDEDVENSKKLIISTVGSIPDSQDSEITYYLGQELSDEFVTIDEYIKNINNVTKKDIIDVSNKIKIDTIYFLKN